MHQVALLIIEYMKQAMHQSLAVFIIEEEIERERRRTQWLATITKCFCEQKRDAQKHGSNDWFNFLLGN